MSRGTKSAHWDGDRSGPCRVWGLGHDSLHPIALAVFESVEIYVLFSACHVYGRGLGNSPPPALSSGKYGPCSTLSHHQRVRRSRLRAATYQPTSSDSGPTAVQSSPGNEEAGVARGFPRASHSGSDNHCIVFSSCTAHLGRHPSVPEKDETASVSYAQAKKHVETTVKNMQNPGSRKMCSKHTKVFLEGRGLPA